MFKKICSTVLSFLMISLSVTNISAYSTTIKDDRNQITIDGVLYETEEVNNDVLFYDADGNVVFYNKLIEKTYKPMTRSMGDYHTGPDGDTYIEIWTAKRIIHPGLASSSASLASTVLSLMKVPGFVGGIAAITSVVTWAFTYNKSDLFYTETCYINTRMTKQYKEIQYYTDDSFKTKLGGIVCTKTELPTGI